VKKVFLSVLAVLALFFVSAACTKKQDSLPDKPALVSATGAYEKYFGTAPTADKGTCYAFVIYFPSKKEPGKVVPFPFFTFDEASLKKVALARLVEGMDIGSYQGEFQPFPAGTRAVINENKGAVTVTLSREFERAVQDGSAENAARSITLTLRQFKGVSTVRILVKGSNTPYDIQTGESTILTPGPPRLLSITAMRDKEAKVIEDLNVFFDRPVEIKELKLLDKDGKQYDGQLFHSVFDMAAVLKPKNPAQFKERKPIKVRWKVVDKLGRQAEGDNVWLLEMKEH